MHSGGSGDWKEFLQTETETATAPIKKGPWTAEEDEVLMDYVKKHGPRDWSSIQSNGLLPRTGKSCRLRWVNKLRPDLKSGCKFTLDEERAVIDMQARFGNKWARIATFLHGRTDNDVKNFWSTRQKRLAKLLQTQLPVRSSRSQRKAPVCSQMPDFEAPVCSQMPYFEAPVCSQMPDFEAPVCSQMPDFEDVLLQNLNSPCIELIQIAESYVNGVPKICCSSVINKKKHAI